MNKYQEAHKIMVKLLNDSNSNVTVADLVDEVLVEMGNNAPNKEYLEQEAQYMK